jgi:hypothetical protein
VGLEAHGHWRLVEIDVLHEVGLLVAIVSDDGLPLELETDAGFLISELLRATDLVDPRETRFIRDKLVDAVYHDC